MHCTHNGDIGTGTMHVARGAGTIVGEIVDQIHVAVARAIKELL